MFSGNDCANNVLECEYCTVVAPYNLKINESNAQFSTIAMMIYINGCANCAQFIVLMHMLCAVRPYKGRLQIS